MSLDLDKRRALSEAKAKVRELLEPERERQKIARAKARRERAKAVDRSDKRQRQPRKKEPAYLAWVRRLPCIAGIVEGGCSGPIEAAHVRYSDAKAGRVNSGMQQKPDDLWTAPLCNAHHQHDQHLRAERAFWGRLGIDPGALCPALHAAFEAHQEGVPILIAATAQARAVDGASPQLPGRNRKAQP